MDRKKERLASTLIIIAAILVVYGAAAYRIKWFPFSEPQDDFQVAGPMVTGSPELARELSELERLNSKSIDLLGKSRKRVDFFYSGGERGEYAPSSCAFGTGGGLSKYAAYIKSQKASSEGQIIVNAGNALAEAIEFEGVERYRQMEKARVFLDFFKAAGYNALNVGQFDLSFGLKFLKDEAAKRSLPYISANLVSPDDKKTIFPPYQIVEAGGLKFGIVGIYPEKPIAKKYPDGAWIDKDADKGKKIPPKEFEVAPIAETLPPVINELKNKGADIIIVLSSRNANDDISFESQFDENINFVISSGGFEVSKRPYWKTKVQILGTGSRGNFLGHLLLYPKTGGAPGIFNYLFLEHELMKELITLNNRLEQLSTLVKNLRKAAAEKTGQDRDELEKKIEENMKQKQAVYEDAERATAMLAGVKEINPANSYYWLKMFPLHSEIKNDPETEKALKPQKVLYENADENPALGGVPETAGWGKYAKGNNIGKFACEKCHPNAFKVYKSTAHFKATDLLDAKNMNNPECLQCHVTAWMRPEGVVDPDEILDEFAGVGCESCHGPGMTHLMSMYEKTKTGLTYIQKPVFKELCQTCHRGYHKNEKPFNYEEAVKKVSCSELMKQKGLTDAPEKNISPEVLKKIQENKKKRNIKD